MPETIGEAFVALRFKPEGIDQIGADAEKQMADAGAKAGTAFSTSWAKNAKDVGKKLSTFVTLPLVGAFAIATREMGEAQQAGAQTAAVIKSTGGAANVTAAEIERLSKSLSKKAGIDDEVVQQGANMLLTFRSVRDEAGKGNDVFTQATKTTLDLATAMGGDFQGAAIQVGKALQDPILGLTALRRVGVAFTQQQQDQIKALVQSGDLLSAQKMILKELNLEFGGSAAAGRTAMGSLKVDIMNMAEEIGFAALPAVEALGKGVGALAHGFSDLPDWGKTIAVGGLAAAAALGPVLNLVGNVQLLREKLTNTASASDGFGNKMAGATNAAIGFAGRAIAGGAAALALSTGLKAVGVEADAANLVGLTAMGATLAGPWGAAAGAAVGIAIKLGHELFGVGESAADAQKRMAGLGNELDKLNSKQGAIRFVQSFSDAVLDGKANARDMAAELQKLAQASPAAAERVVQGLRDMGTFSQSELGKLELAVNKGTVAFHSHSVAADNAAARNKAVAGSALLAAGGLDTEADSATNAADQLAALYDKQFAAVHADEQARDALDKLNTVYDETLQSTGSVAQATEAQNRALVSAEESFIKAAEAAGAKSDADHIGADAATVQAANTAAQVRELQGLMASLAPDSPLRAFLQQYIDKLNDPAINGTHTATVNLVTNAAQVFTNLADQEAEFRAQHPELAGFRYGGFTDWPRNQGRPAILHGQEYVLDADTVSAIKRGAPSSGGGGASAVPVAGASSGAASAGLFDGATVHIGDQGVISDLDYWQRTRRAFV